MSSTFSSWTRERSENGYAPRTSACRSSTEISSSAQIATICWARTSSGFRGICVSSIAPSSIRRATTADSSRSARNFGKIRPFETAPSSWPAPPTRCRPRAADPLQPTRDRLRRLDLDHEVDGAHVDPELERRGGDQARDLAALQQLLDLEPLLARDRAVVGAGDLLLRELVQPEGEPLGEPAVVDEDDGRAVLAHELEQRRVDGGPDRPAAALRAGVHLLAVCGHRVGERRVGGELAHVLDGHDHL